jgi:hypothetical protein
MSANGNESRSVDRLIGGTKMPSWLRYPNNSWSRHTLALSTNEDRIFKIYDEQFAKEYKNEFSALRIAEGIDLVPAVFGGGRLDCGRYYIEMQRLPGACLREIFDSLDLGSKHRCLARLIVWRAKLTGVGNRDCATPRGAFTQASRLSWAASRLHHVAPDARELAAACYQYAIKILTDDNIEPLSLVHRDFALRNLLAKHEDGGDVSLTGVLDFEHAFIGSPTSDIADIVIEDFSANPDIAFALIEAWRSESPTPVSHDRIVGAIGLSLLLGLVREEKCGPRKLVRSVAAQRVLEWLPRL